MIEYATIDRAALDARVDARLAQLGAQLLAADADSASGRSLVACLCELAVMRDRLARETRPAAQQALVSYLLTTYDLAQVPLPALRATVSVTLNVGGGGGGPVQWSALVGDPASSATLVEYVAGQVAQGAGAPYRQVTYAQALALLEQGELLPGVTYELTDFPGLSGTVAVTAASASQFAVIGTHLDAGTAEAGRVDVPGGTFTPLGDALGPTLSFEAGTDGTLAGGSWVLALPAGTTGVVVELTQSPSFVGLLPSTDYSFNPVTATLTIPAIISPGDSVAVVPFFGDVSTASDARFALVDQQLNALDERVDVLENSAYVPVADCTTLNGLRTARFFFVSRPVISIQPLTDLGAVAGQVNYRSSTALNATWVPGTVRYAANGSPSGLQALLAALQGDINALPVGRAGELLLQTNLNGTGSSVSDFLLSGFTNRKGEALPMRSEPGNLIRNSDFVDSTWWDTSTWVLGNGHATASGAATTMHQQDQVMTTGLHRLKYTIAAVGPGGVRIVPESPLGTFLSDITRTTPGTYATDIYLTAGATVQTGFFHPDGVGAEFSVDLTRCTLIPL